MASLSRAARAARLTALAALLLAPPTVLAGRPVTSAAPALPLHFEPRADAAGFAARSRDGTLQLSRGETKLVIGTRAVRMRWLGARPDATLSGEALLPGHVNHVHGTDPRGWRLGVPTFGRVRYTGLYPGVDAVFYGRAGNVEHDLHVAPGAAPESVQLELLGADTVAIDPRGDLVLQVGGRSVRLHAPVSYQESAGVRRPIASRWALDGRRARIAVGRYDRSLPLVIDPVLSYASYFGGNGEDNGGGVHADASGITFGGLTTSSDLPEQSSGAAGFDSFAARLDPSGATLLWVTYFGGMGDDIERDLVVDAAGDAYLFGETTSADLPTTPGAFDRSCGADGSCNGGADMFVAKLSGADGSLLWATFLGGSGSDIAGKIAVAGTSAVVAGYTNSSDLPATPGAWDETCGTDGTCNETFDPERTVRRDCFVAKLAPDAADLAYATYLGGAAFDRCFGVDVDAAGRAVVVGSTFSADFPASEGAYDRACGSDGACDAADDGFAAMFTADGSDLVYATFLGGSGNGDAAIDEYGWAVDAAADGRARIVGQTDSADFPTPGGADTSFGAGPLDAFVAELDATGSSLAFASFLGGSGSEQGLDIAVDARGRIHVSGVTTSTDLPQVDPLPGPGNACASCEFGFTEAFVASLDPSGGELLFASFLGGTNSDYGSSLAVEDVPGGTILHLLGDAASADFPLVDPYQAAHGVDPGGGANYDLFVARVVPEPGVVSAAASVLALRFLSARRLRRRRADRSGIVRPS